MQTEFQLGRIEGGDGAPKTLLVIDGTHHDLAACFKAADVERDADMGTLLANWNAAFDDIAKTVASLEPSSLAGLTVPASTPLITPVPRPGTIFCAAANYSDHVTEMAKSGFTGPASAVQNAPSIPQRPYHFLKAVICFSEPNHAIELPSADHRIDWEVELGAVIGAPAKHATRDSAMAHVAGYVVTNDVSCRAATWREDRPNIRSDWLAGKSYDTFFPVGPYFLPAQFVTDYRTLRLRLWVNGELHQDGLAKDMIFNIEQQIEYLSGMLTLQTGDIVATGTPAGVGQGKGAYLKVGDIVEAEITGMGRQRNEVQLQARLS